MPNRELDEKFVSDDGISTVEEPVTPAGGLPKKRRTDVKKAIDPKAEKITEGDDMDDMDDEDDMDDDEDEDMDEAKSKKQMKESIESLFEGFDLTEDFKDKVSLVFEAAVNEAATDRALQVAESLEEEFEHRLNESVNEAMEEITGNLDSYLDYVVTEWLDDNKIAIESGIKVEMAESFMDGLKGLFYEHNVQIDEEIVDVVSDLEVKLEESNVAKNKLINRSLKLSEEIKNLKSEMAFAEICEGLTTSQVERMRVLSERVDHSDIDSYKEGVITIKESFFKKASFIVEDMGQEDEIIAEDTSVKTRVSEYDSVNAIVAAINARNLK